MAKGLYYKPTRITKIFFADHLEQEPLTASVSGQCDHGRDQDHQVEQEEQHHRGLQLAVLTTGFLFTAFCGIV